MAVLPLMSYFFIAARRGVARLGTDRRGKLLGDHDGRDIGVGARHGRHHRGVGDAQAVDAAHAAGRSRPPRRDRRAHAAGAADMESAGDIAADVLGEALVVGDQVLQRDRIAGKLRKAVVADRRAEIEQPLRCIAVFQAFAGVF